MNTGRRAYVAVSRFEVIKGEIFKPPPLSNLQWPAILGAMGLGFCLSLLIFMDHNIAGAMVNSPDNWSVAEAFLTLMLCCLTL